MMQAAILEKLCPFSLWQMHLFNKAERLSSGIMNIAGYYISVASPNQQA